MNKAEMLLFVFTLSPFSLSLSLSRWERGAGVPHRVPVRVAQRPQRSDTLPQSMTA